MGRRRDRKRRAPQSFTLTPKSSDRQLCRSFLCRCGLDLVLPRRTVPADRLKCPTCRRVYGVSDCGTKVGMIEEPASAPVDSKADAPKIDPDDLKL